MTRAGYALGFSRLFLEIVYKDWCDSGEAAGFSGLYICANYLCVQRYPQLLELSSPGLGNQTDSCCCSAPQISV
eukprot:COSAG06_NODE_781_length_12364_cov_6.388912_4_plen_74_part_00